MSNRYDRPRQQSKVKIKCLVLGAASAGKTSILRRYFSNTFQPGRRPTNGSDYYTATLRNPLYDDSASDKNRHPPCDEKKDEDWITTTTTSSTRVKHTDGNVAQQFSSATEVTLQMWDTPGRERKHTANLPNSFFRNVDAAMLVYDATSSTSFTQLLQWHSDLMSRVRQIEDDEDDQNSRNSRANNQRHFPVLIVANKMDIIEARTQHVPPQQKVVPQRDILGLGGQFKGKDSRYEYRASPPVEGKDAKKSIQRRGAPSELASSYLATGEAWTTDGSYLDSVVKTEDGSFPDRDMVLLWCLRNGLRHVETSALTGRGVEDAVHGLVEIALQSMKKKVLEQNQKPRPHQQPFLLDAPKPTLGFAIRKANDELNLRERYEKKEEGCFLCSPFHCCKK